MINTKKTKYIKAGGKRRSRRDNRTHVGLQFRKSRTEISGGKWFIRCTIIATSGSLQITEKCSSFDTHF